MEAFDRFVDVVDRLLGPGGCPWDREQTLLSMRKDLLEETNEVIEAVESGDSDHIAEELGDLFFNVVFLCRLAKKEGHTNIPQVLKGITEKLIRRHPHVFGDAKVESSEDVLKQWEAIKRDEKNNR